MYGGILFKGDAMSLKEHFIKSSGHGYGATAALLSGCGNRRWMRENQYE